MNGLPSLADVCAAALPPGWRLAPGEFWCHAGPPAVQLPDQGWKLHVCATPLAAPLVLAAVVPVLVGHCCPFKFAGTLARAAALTSARFPRAGAGKFVTAYPGDPERAARLGAALHAATAGLPGPRILSDLPHAEGSLVHYRYGGFAGRRELGDGGEYEPVLVAPDGGREPDLRRPWFAAPGWAPPLPGHPAPRPGARGPVLLAGRYVVRGALRHSSRGGVYLAEDAGTGAEVVVKEARRHAGATLLGADARDALRHEHAVLADLAAGGLAPRPLALLDQGGNRYLVEERLPGSTLRRWIAGQLGADGLPPRSAVAMALRLAELLRRVHDRGWVVRDLSPDNVVVGPDGSVRMIDTECVTWPGQLVTPAFTPGYGAPEVGAGVVAPAPPQAADLYALGAVLVLLASGADPVLPADRPPARDQGRRLAALVAAVAPGCPALRQLAPVVTGLTAAPQHRWDLARSAAWLRTLADPPPGGPPAGSAAAGGDRPRSAAPPGDLPASAGTAPADAAALLLRDGLAHLVATADTRRDRVWDSTPYGQGTDPCAVQHGAAGPLAVLAAALRSGAAPQPDRARALARQVGRWILRRLEHPDRLLPGLYFGRAGTAWALHDAGLALDDPELAAAGQHLARRLPTRWPNPDVCHGTAGAGLALLHFAEVTGRDVFAERARRCAEELLPAVPGATGPPPGTATGFAHGTAGIGAFLLAAGTVLGEPRYADAAHRAGGALLRAARLDAGTVWWPATWEDPERAPERPMRWHWCSGATGVGTFLLRLWRAGGDPACHELAELAAEGARRDRWRSGTAACHGLAGDGEYLLDLADLLGEPRYRRRADEFVAALWARHAVHDGRRVVADESRTEVRADYGTGLAGVLGFLLRRGTGGTRRWMAGEPTRAVEEGGGNGGNRRERPAAAAGAR